MCCQTEMVRRWFYRLTMKTLSLTMGDKLTMIKCVSS